MEDKRETLSGNCDEKVPIVPTHGNWAEERGFGQQTSRASEQYDLKLADPPLLNSK
jgi:hypothetical protein